MKKRLRFLIVTMGLVFLNLAGAVLYAQSPRTIEVGPHFGGTAYFGDLNVWRNMKQWDWKSLKQFHYDLGAVVRYNYDTRWSFRLGYSHLKVRAGDAVAVWRPQSKLNFQSTVDDLSLMTEFNFFDYYTGKNDKGFSPYIFAGISGLMYYVQPFTGEKDIDQYRLGNGRRFAISIPFGVGCKISISEHLATTVEWRMHSALTDRLDDVSDNYPASDEHVLLVAKYRRNDYGEVLYSQGKPILEDYQVVMLKDKDPETILVYDFTDPTRINLNDPDGYFPEGYQRGNARTNDWFGMFNISLTWKFVLPEKNACKMTE